MSTAAAAVPTTPCPHPRLAVTTWDHWNSLLVQCPMCQEALRSPMQECAALSRPALSTLIGHTFGPFWQTALAEQDATWKILAAVLAGANRTGVRRVRTVEVSL